MTASDISPDRPLRHEVSILQPNIRSEAEPLTIEISVTNSTEELFVYNERREVLGYCLESDDFILLLKDERPYEYNANRGFWQASVPISIDAEIQTAGLSPDETHKQSLVLVARQIEDLPSKVPEKLESDVTVTVSAPQKVQRTDVLMGLYATKQD
ncbi:hypothetical protein [Halovenus salina]|uniref:hypothetical protein n=1 Tax=Halovenus salina TaxID=1510225 RepID=UPI0022609088|nr:hypothetical protein [Halovenus salina]